MAYEPNKDIEMAAKDTRQNIVTKLRQVDVLIIISRLSHTNIGDRQLDNSGIAGSACFLVTDPKCEFR